MADLSSINSDSLRKKTKYVIPNAITALSIVMGMASVFYAFNGNFVTASWVILYSTILDKLDGSTARALKASSPFGGQLDSFSDFVAFGIAPAFLIFAISTTDPTIRLFYEQKDTPFFLYFSIIFFILASAMRLARFNLESVPGSSYMMGMATTVAGGLVATYVLTCYSYIEYEIANKALKSLPYVLIFLGALEVSTLPIAKVGKKKNKWFNRLDACGFLLSVFCVVTRSWPEFLLVAASTYLAVSFWGGWQKRKEIYSEWKQRGVMDEDESVLAAPEDLP